MLIWLTALSHSIDTSLELFSADAIVRTERKLITRSEGDMPATLLHLNSKSSPAVFVRESPEDIEAIIEQTKRGMKASK